VSGLPMITTTHSHVTETNQMCHTHEKGRTVSHTEHNAKSASTPKAGLFAVLGGLLQTEGTGVPSARIVLAALATAFALSLTVGAPSTLASGPPRLEGAREGCALGSPTIVAGVGTITRTSVSGPFGGCFYTEDLTTELKLEWSTSESGPWIPVPGGTETAPGKENIPGYPDKFKAGEELTGLSPETIYYLKLTATNSAGNATEIGHFETLPLRPGPNVEEVRNVTGVSAVVTGTVNTRGFATHWRWELSSEPGNPASWAPVPGEEGSITQAEAEAARKAKANDSPESGPYPGVKPLRLTGLHAATTYSVRLFAESEPEYPEGSGKKSHKEATSPPSGFKTSGPPAVSTFATHALHGEFFRLFGSVNPESVPTSNEQTITIEGAPTGGTFTLTFNGQKTEPIAFDAPDEGPGSVRNALNEVGVEGYVEGPPGGPYTVFFINEVSEPQIEADASGLLPSGTTITVLTNQPGGVVYDTHYHFEYVGQKQFEAEGGFASHETKSTAEVDLGSGDSDEVLGADLPALTPGEAYRYRLVATNTSPGDPVADGEEKTLTVLAAPESGAEAPCENELFRTGPSAELPDCRAYEQITPVEKEGSQELFSYGVKFAGGVLPAVDGESVVVYSPLVAWGSTSSDGQSPYVFTRSFASSDWLMKAAAAQPETGVSAPNPQLYNSDQTQLAFETSVETVIGAQPTEIEYKVGPVGGPYSTVASIPGRDRLEGTDGWVASSEDFSKLILQIADHTLLGPSTGTNSGNDLYEYAAGQLRQVNVAGGYPGSAIGSCGAVIVHGHEGGEGGTMSSPHAVSTDGSRVFFEEVPGNHCGEPSHLYMRVDGDETVDIGPYSFLAANGQGSQVLLVKRAGEAREVMLYDSETKTVKPLKGFVAHDEALSELLVSTDMSTVYFSSGERLTPEAPATPGAPDLYRYDVGSETLSFVAQTAIREEYASPEGRYFYFDSPGVAGLPGGSSDPLRNNEGEIKLNSNQVYRYDSAEDVVECMSCASAFDPEPRTGAFFGLYAGSGTLQTQDGMPAKTVSSANGEYAFFETPAALVRQDIDGEVAPETGLFPEHKSTEQNTSVSSDVYEWREYGVHGCAHVQGCLSLITSGTGGFLNLLIGSTQSGDDVFIYTSSQLTSTDGDTAGDVYDARVNGGFTPPPPRPVECEADACSTPASAPNDVTPSSFTFSGLGDAIIEPLASVKAKTTKRKTKTKKKKIRKGKSKTKGKKATRKVAAKASKGNQRRGR
jgi:hypothetical protein